MRLVENKGVASRELRGAYASLGMQVHVYISGLRVPLDLGSKFR